MEGVVVEALAGVVRLDGGSVEGGTAERMMAAIPWHRPPEVGARVGPGAAFAWSAPAVCGKAPGAAEGRAAAGPLLAAAMRLDNRDELRRLLAVEAEGEGGGDLELLRRAVRAWPDGWPGRLRGAFAVALWEGDARRLTLVRDRAGERALYWGRSGEEVLFASEPLQLAASGRVDAAPHRRRVLAHLVGADPAPEWSFFRGARRLPAGHRLRVDRRGAVVDRWADPEPAGPALDAAAAAGELRRRLGDAVARRLAGEGESGLLLSGGLDSSAIAVAAAERLAAAGRRLHAFTWASPRGDGIDERELSGTLVRATPAIEEHPVEADGLWPLSRHPEAYADANEPVSSAWPDLALASAEAARAAGVTRLLNGIGGDPVVGWLEPDLALLLRGRLATLGRRWRRSGLRRSGLARQLAAALRPRRLPAWLTPEARRLAREAGLTRPVAALRDLASPRAFRRFCLASPQLGAALERYEREGRRLGVRSEAPWLDADLAALVLALPDCALDPMPPGKSLLRAAMAGRLPAPILARAKGAGPVSDLGRRGLLAEGGERVRRLLAADCLHDLGLLDCAKFTRTYEDHGARGIVVPRLWEVATCAIWCEVRSVEGRASKAGA